MPLAILLQVLMPWIGIGLVLVLIHPLVLKCLVWFIARLILLILICDGFLIMSVIILPMAVAQMMLNPSLLFRLFELLIVVFTIICMTAIVSRLFLLRLRNLTGCIIGIGKERRCDYASWSVSSASRAPYSSHSPRSSWRLSVVVL